MVTLRLTRGVPVGGIDPELARELARLARRARTVEEVAFRMRLTPCECRSALIGLRDAGYMVERRDRDGVVEWQTTIAGNALAMASFAKPITRARADATLTGLLERAAKYNIDDTKPYVITQLIVFGSYCDPDVAQLGDLDIAIKFLPRGGPEWEEPQAMIDYGSRSGRTFSTFLDQLGWGQTELFQILRNRSGCINLTPEDVTTLTDRWQVVYTHA